MPFVPKSAPRRRKKCGCQMCIILGNPEIRRRRFMTVVAASYDREELRIITQTARATMLPRDSS